MNTPKEKLYKIMSPSTDYPPEVVKEWGGEFVPLPDGRMAVKWPTVYVPHTDAIPSDCPAPMGVPITALDKGIGEPGSDFRIVGLINGDGFVDGKNVYKHIVIVNEALRARLRKQGAASEAGRGMRLTRLDEAREEGRIFADWLRKELLACGDATERAELLACGEMGAYVLTGCDGEGFAGGEDAPLVGGCRLAPGIHGDEPVAPLAEVEAGLFDGEGPLAAVCHANGAVLVSAAVWGRGIALHKGDFCAVLPAADVRQELERAKGKRTDGGEDGERVEDWLEITHGK